MPIFQDYNFDPFTSNLDAFFWLLKNLIFQYRYPCLSIVCVSLLAFHTEPMYSLKARINFKICSVMLHLIGMILIFPVYSEITYRLCYLHFINI